jgi:hypothetical protein
LSKANLIYLTETKKGRTDGKMERRTDKGKT